MENKKSKKANLEKKKGIFIQVGLVVALSIILISFEWTSAPQQMDEINMVQDIAFENDIISIPRDEPKEGEVKPEVPDIVEVIEIVEDDEDDDTWVFDPEVKENMEIDISKYINTEEVIIEDEVFVVVEQMPTFNGGDPKVEFMKYISKNLMYPEIAAENGVSGRVMIQFTVNTKGDLVNAFVYVSRDAALDKEALRVVNSSPKWSPGMQRGKPASVLFNFPINFKLQ